MCVCVHCLVFVCLDQSNYAPVRLAFFCTQFLLSTSVVFGFLLTSNTDIGFRTASMQILGIARMTLVYFLIVCFSQSNGMRVLDVCKIVYAQMPTVNVAMASALHWKLI